MVCTSSRWSVALFGCAVLLLLSAVSCSDSDGSDSVFFEGTLTDNGAGGIPDVAVCALGECDVTDEAGAYALQVEEEDFEGEDGVVFSLQGPLVDSEVAVPGFDEEATEGLQLDFATDAQGDVVLTSMNQIADDGIDSDRELTFAGILFDPNLQPLPGAEVCTFNRCDTTRADGRWSMTVDERTFDPVQGIVFSVDSPNGAGSATITGIAPTTDRLEIELQSTSSGRVVVRSVQQFDGDDPDNDEAGDFVNEPADDLGAEGPEDFDDEIDEQLDDDAEDVDELIDELDEGIDNLETDHGSPGFRPGVGE
ncbi:MAG: hypothetical protein KDD69_07230 [Bdellovibrionales bacterium]|nr:hypothetical protein [Bdellovibrionales bacterium]